MSKRIIYTNAEGVLCVITPALGGALSLEEVLSKDVPEGCVGYVVDVSDLPTCRTFRGAWVEDNGIVSVNLEKAKTIQKERIRTARKPLLEALDVAYARADEVGDFATKSSIIAEKEALRDFPTRVDSAETLEELTTIMPA